MDSTERRIRLPEGAFDLHEYVRFYAYTESGQVHAVYTTPMDDLDWAFATSLSDAERAEASADHEEPRMEAGDRRWVDTPSRLPSISDGGCTVIEFEFDSAETSELTPECNVGG